MKQRGFSNRQGRLSADHLPESAFYMVGTIDEAVEKARQMAAEAA